MDGENTRLPEQVPKGSELAHTIWLLLEGINFTPLHPGIFSLMQVVSEILYQQDFFENIFTMVLSPEILFLNVADSLGWHGAL